MCRWTPEENAQLMTLHDKLAGDWERIATELTGRSSEGVFRHFCSLKRKAGEGRHGVNQEGAGRPWSPEEEVKLLNLADKYDLNWERIATELTGRSSEGVYKRWLGLRKRKAGEGIHLVGVMKCSACGGTGHTMRSKTCPRYQSRKKRTRTTNGS